MPPAALPGLLAEGQPQPPDWVLGFAKRTLSNPIKGSLRLTKKIDKPIGFRRVDFFATLDGFSGHTIGSLHFLGCYSLIVSR
jgi:hypothetical protein